MLQQQIIMFLFLLVGEPLFSISGHAHTKPTHPVNILLPGIGQYHPATVGKSKTISPGLIWNATATGNSLFYFFLLSCADEPTHPANIFLSGIGQYHAAPIAYVEVPATPQQYKILVFCSLLSELISNIRPHAHETYSSYRHTLTRD